MSMKQTSLLNISSICSRRVSTGLILTTSGYIRPRHLSTDRQRSASPKTSDGNDGVSEGPNTPKDSEEEGAMSRRLSEMTEESMLEGGRSARRNMEHVGFSDELKKQLEERIASSSFKSDYAAAHSIVNMPVRRTPLRSFPHGPLLTLLCN